MGSQQLFKQSFLTYVYWVSAAYSVICKYNRKGLKTEYLIHSGVFYDSVSLVQLAINEHPLCEDSAKDHEGYFTYPLSKSSWL